MANTYLFPEAPDEKYKYFPSTAGTQCSFRKLDEKEKNSLILKAFKTCVGTEGTEEERIKRSKKYCFGWNQMNRFLFLTLTAALLIFDLVRQIFFLYFL